MFGGKNYGLTLNGVQIATDFKCQIQDMLTKEQETLAVELRTRPCPTTRLTTKYQKRNGE